MKDLQDLLLSLMAHHGDLFAIGTNIAKDKTDAPAILGFTIDTLQSINYYADLLEKHHQQFPGI